MSSEFTIVDAAYNLLKAAEKNTTELEDLLVKVNKTSEQLRNKTSDIEKTVSESIHSSIITSASKISSEVTQKLSDANEKAMNAADRLDSASRRTFLYLALLQLLFLIFGIVVLWFFFMRNIPTDKELKSLRATKDELEKYGNIYNCDEKKCLEIESTKSQYTTDHGRVHLYIIKPRN